MNDLPAVARTDTIGDGASQSYTRIEEITDSVKVPVELMSFDVE